MADPVPTEADKIAEAAAAPASATADGQSADAHPIPDKIAADQYQKACAAAAAAEAAGRRGSGWGGMVRPAKAVLPGATGRR